MYYPILKGKQGEFDAWRNASPAVRADCTPLFELVGGEDAEKAWNSFTDYVLRSCSSGDVIGVDFGAVVQEEAFRSDLSDFVARVRDQGADVLPVVQSGESSEFLARVQEAFGVEAEGVVVRLSNEDGDLTDLSLLREHLVSAWDLALLFPEASARLLLDFGPIGTELQMFEGIECVKLAIDWCREGQWDEIVVAAGAFPASVSDIPYGLTRRIPRRDAQFWQGVRSQVGVPVSYGDYAVNNPMLPEGPQRGPAPSLRYTVGEEWLVRRERKLKDAPKPLASFFEVARALAEEGELEDSDYSWGDGEIHKRAVSEPTVGSGNATQWRAWATSHHLAYITSHLANPLGA